MRYITHFFITLFYLAFSKLAWAGEPGDDVELGYEYEEIPTHLTEEQQKKLAADYGLEVKQEVKQAAGNSEGTSQKAEKKEEVKSAAETPEVREIKVEGEITRGKAIELVKDYKDDDEIQIGEETLTKAEFLKKFDKKEEKPPVEDVKYMVAGKELDQKGYDELMKKAKKHYQWDDEYVKSRRKEDLLKDLGTFANQIYGDIKINERHQYIAKQKREIELAAEQLETRYQNISDKLKELEEKKAKNDVIIAKDLDEIEDDEERRDLKDEKRAAKRYNEEIEQKKKEYEEAQISIDRKVKNFFYKSSFLDIQDMIPELSLPEGEDVNSILSRIEKPGFTDWELANKVQMILELTNAYYEYMMANDKSKMGIDGYFRMNRHHFGIIPEKASKNGKKEESSTAEDGNKLKKRVLKLISDQRKHPFSPQGGGAQSFDTLDEEERKIAENRRKIGIVDDYSTKIG